ncbi:hypothetical protein CF327_g5276 [Tilletia walkeri]|nr:hypothetical protein CF327_g5276 [Tilletia walkeri]
MDHAVDLPVSQGFDSVWIVVCLFSGEAHFVPCHKSDDANTLAQQFLANIFRLHGLPDRIISNRGATFISQFWHGLLHLLDVKASSSTAYHPQTNGKSERTIQTLEDYLRCYISYHQDDWAAWLPLAEFALNNARSAPSEQSPFFITRGFHPTFTPGIATSSVVSAAEQLSEHLERLWNDVRAQLRWAKDGMAKYYNHRRSPGPTYKIGDQVWLLRRNIPTTCPSNKLDHRCLGPFKIAAQVGNSAYRLNLPSQLPPLHPVFPVVLLEPYVGSNNPGSAPSPSHLAPTLDKAWQSVEQVLDQRKRKIQNRYHYLLRWRDKPISEDTWRPLDDTPISLELLLQVFHRRYPRYTPREAPSARSVPLAPPTAAAPPQSRVSSSSHSLQPRPSAIRDPGVSSRPSPARPSTPAHQPSLTTSRATLQTTLLAPHSHGP